MTPTDLIPAAPEPVLPIPAATEMEVIERLAPKLARAGLSTTRRPVEQIIAIALLGREAGIPVMTALQGIHIIDGKPSFGIHLVAGLLARAGLRWEEVQCDEQAAEVVFHRAGWKSLHSKFSMDDARRAELTGKDNWKKYPRQMLWSRAFVDGARRIGADVLAGMPMYSADELGSVGNEDAPLPDASGTPATPDAPDTFVAPDAPSEPPPRADEPAREALREKIARFGALRRQVDGPKAFTDDDERKWLEWAEGELAKGVELDALLTRIQQKIDQLSAADEQPGGAE